MSLEQLWWRIHFDMFGLEELIHRQDGVVSRSQWLLDDGDDVSIRRLVRRREWRPIFPGVYATQRSDPTAFGLAVGALLYAGPGAVWSHATAAHHLGLTKSVSPSIHLTVPSTRRIRPQPGLLVHRSNQVLQRQLRGVWPPRVTCAHAVIDQLSDCLRLDEALARVADSCQTGRVHLDDITAALSVRNVRWGKQLRLIAQDALKGSDSLLEVNYVCNVERRHRLPASIRQRSCDGDTSDCAYGGFDTLVELDGRVHLRADKRWRDMSRDNRAAMRGEVTLRYGWFDVNERCCGVAAQVYQVLHGRGFRGVVRRCGPGCALQPLD